MPRQREAGGTYAERVSDDDLLHFFDRGQRDFYSAGEIAEEFDLDRSQAHRRVAALAEADELERVEVGSRNVLWWRPRDVVVLLPETDGYAVLDHRTGVASQGETRADALRMLAEAIESHDGDGEVAASTVYEEVGLDPDEVAGDASPPWSDDR